MSPTPKELATKWDTIADQLGDEEKQLVARIRNRTYRQPLLDLRSEITFVAHAIVCKRRQSGSTLDLTTRPGLQLSEMGATGPLAELTDENLLIIIAWANRSHYERITKNAAGFLKKPLEITRHYTRSGPTRALTLGHLRTYLSIALSKNGMPCDEAEQLVRAYLKKIPEPQEMEPVNHHEYAAPTPEEFRQLIEYRMERRASAENLLEFDRDTAILYVLREDYRPINAARLRWLITLVQRYGKYSLYNPANERGKQEKNITPLPADANLVFSRLEEAMRPNQGDTVFQKFVDGPWQPMTAKDICEVVRKAFWSSPLRKKVGGKFGRRMDVNRRLGELQGLGEIAVGQGRLHHETILAYAEVNRMIEDYTDKHLAATTGKLGSSTNWRCRCGAANRVDAVTCECGLHYRDSINANERAEGQERKSWAPGVWDQAREAIESARDSSRNSLW